jgi:hypothetical protein
MKQNIEIVSLIYKSVIYLKYIVKQLKSDLCKVDGWDVGIRIVANDANDGVLKALEQIEMPYTIFNNLDKNEYYMNRVYRCYNYCVITSNYDNICLINSDNGFSNGWLSNLLKHHNGINIPCSRLVESGKMTSGKYGISHNFGKTCDEFEFSFNDWLFWADKHKEGRVDTGGLYMPGIFEKRRFIESGMYPEGNIYSYGKVGSMVGGVKRTGDEFFFHEVLEKKFGMKHITVFDSLIYHIQEGEKDE